MRPEPVSLAQATAGGPVAEGRAGAGPRSPAPRQTVRAAVRSLLEASPAFGKLGPEQRRKLAHGLVSITETAIGLVAEEAVSDPAAPVAGPFATGLSAQGGFDPGANRQLAGVARDTLDAIAFPRFVTELVNGVFRGLIDANAQQIQAYVDMIAGVTAATADSQGATGADQARLWLVQQFPDAYELAAGEGEWGEQATNGPMRLRLRDGQDAPPAADIAGLLGLTGREAEGLDPEEPEEGLLGKVRAFLSRQRQKVLASLLTLGMNRLVIDHGKIKAGMNFSIDARSAAEENRAQRFELKHSSRVGGSVGFGPWSVNASMTNSIGMVNTSQSHRREEMNQRVNMNADIELHFHSDYMPLNRLAASDSVQRIRAASANPQADIPTELPQRPAETPDQTAARGVVQTPINFDPPPPPPAPTPSQSAAPGDDRGPGGGGNAGVAPPPQGGADGGHQA